MPFIVQMDEEEFRIVGPDGETGEAVSYDAVATLVIDDEVYICRVEDADAQDVKVECVTQTRAMISTLEEVSFADDDEEAGEDDEDDEDGGDDDDPDGGEEIEVEEKQVA